MDNLTFFRASIKMCLSCFDVTNYTDRCPKINQLFIPGINPACSYFNESLDLMCWYFILDFYVINLQDGSLYSFSVLLSFIVSVLQMNWEASPFSKN